MAGKAPGEGSASKCKGIAQQCRRLNLASEGLAGACTDWHELILGGDLNIDRHTPNNPSSRPDLKALTPYLEYFLMSNNLTQIITNLHVTKSAHQVVYRIYN